MADQRTGKTKRIGPFLVTALLVGFLTPCLSAFPQNNPAEQTPLSNTKALVYTAGLPRPVEQPLHLGPGPHLFMDDYLIESSENLVRRVAIPQRDAAISNPVVTGKEDGCFQPYMTILRDPETKRFRMWYGHRTEAFDTGQSHVALIESEDGIHWQRPARVLKDPAPIQFGVSVLDEGPEFQPASHRFRLAWYMDGGMKLAVSPEGAEWALLGPDVLLHHNHDIDSLAFDPIRGRYHATISVYRPGEVWAGDRRITMQSCSTDLRHWTPPHYIITPEDGPDPGQTQFYAMDGYLARGGLFIGMVKVLRDDLKADDPPNPPDAYGVGYTALAWSRDGETWYRDREHFFDPDPAPGAWDHAHAWIDDQVLVNGEVYLYYGGYAHGHKVNRFEERQIGLVKIKRDRYVARVSGSETGRLKTPLLVLEGGSLAVNVNAQRGWLKAQLLDATANPLPGFCPRRLPAGLRRRRQRAGALDPPLDGSGLTARAYRVRIAERPTLCLRATAPGALIAASVLFRRTAQPLDDPPLDLFLDTPGACRPAGPGAHTWYTPPLPDLQPPFQLLQSQQLVAVLRPGLRGQHHDPRGQVPQPHRRIRGILLLSPGARAPEEREFQVFFWQWTHSRP